MIRVIVAEDEPPIAKSIKKLAEEYDGVRVVCTAINGKRVLEYLEKHEADLIFSDVKMPVMDGLTLAKHINTDYPDVMMIVISGFQEFEFARTAIRYGVQNYLLKPISRESLHEALDTVNKELIRRTEETKRSALERVINGKENTFTHDEEACGVALLCVGSYPLAPDSLMPEPGEVFDNTGIEAYINSMLRGKGSCICVSGKSLAERAIVFPAGSEAEILDITRALYDYLRGRCEMAVTLAVSGEATPINLVGEAFGKLRKKLYKEIRLFTPRYILSGETETGHNIDPAGFGLELVQMLKTKNQDAIREASLRLVKTLYAQGVRQNEFVVQLERLAMNYFDGMLNLHELGELKMEIQTAVTASVSVEELAAEIADVLFYQLKTEGQMEKDSLQTLCEEVAAYIRLNHRGGITASALGQRFGISSTQLAKKFKDYFGISVSEYLNKYRIELAQAMMRENKKLMVKEVALEVGYNDQYYFSKTFKKITGKWPTEYSANE